MLYIRKIKKTNQQAKQTTKHIKNNLKNKKNRTQTKTSPTIKKQLKLCFIQKFKNKK